MIPTLVLLLSACNLTPKPVDTDTGTGGGDDSGTTSGNGPTIFDIRNGVHGDGEVLTLEGVVVSSEHTYDGEGLFIQDPAGGAKSGLYVWAYNGVADVYAGPGDEVTVTGTVTDFYGWTEFVIDSPDKIVITGEATVPAPVDLGDGAGVNWDDYESVPVTLTNQTVTGKDDFGAGYLSSGVELDDGFARLDFDCRGSFASLTGIVFYTYEAWSVNPRTEAEGVGYVEAEPIAASIYEIQHDGVCGPVELTDVVATSDVWEDDDGAYFFVQDQGGGPWTGLVVYVDHDTTDVTTGWQGAVSGTVDEFYGLTEVTVTDPALLVRNGSGIPVASVLSAAPEDWEEYEAALVTLENVEVTTEEGYGQVATNYANLFVDDLFYDFDAAKGDVWSSVTGPVWYSYNEWKLVPRTADDLR